MIKKSLYILICAILLSTLAFAAPQDMNREMNPSLPPAQNQERMEERNFDGNETNRQRPQRGDAQQMPNPQQMPGDMPMPQQMPESQITEIKTDELTAADEPKITDFKQEEADVATSENSDTQTTGTTTPDVTASATQIPGSNVPNIGSEMPNFQMPEGGSRPSREGMPEGGWDMMMPGQEGGGFQMGNFPGDRGNMFGGMSNQNTQTPKTFKDIVIEYLTPILSMVFLGLGFIFVIFYKRKKY